MFKLNSESSDTEARPSRTNQHLTNIHKTNFPSPPKKKKNQTNIPKRQNRKVQALKAVSYITLVKVRRREMLK